jgi:beta-lactamase regulating signal transducer with metallopeptidase domain
MDWMNNLFVVLILTTITGTIFYVMGIPFRKIWFKNSIRLLRFQLRVTQGVFLVPFVYIVLYVRTRVYLPGFKSAINLFYYTPATVRMSILLTCVWIVFFLTQLISRVSRCYQWVQICQGNIPEEDMEIQALFMEICERLGVGGKITLCRNDSVSMPCITYHHGYTVVLPLECYTRKEAAIIFCHEICHYLNGDLYRKTVGTAANLIHAFNPVARAATSELNLACEEYCDSVACRRGDEFFTDKEYYGMILDELKEDRKRERYNLLAFAETRSDYERRVECMSNNRLHGNIKKGTAVLLSACFLMGSSITALAVGDGVTVAYEIVANATDTRVEDGVDTTVAIELTDSLSDKEVIEEFARAYDLNPDDVIMRGEDDIETIGDFITINWPGIPAGKTYMSSGFSQEVGDSVFVSVSGEPTDINYQMGIKDPKQVMRYAEGSGDLSHTFAISIKGRYYFFVTNLDSSRVLDAQATIIR